MLCYGNTVCTVRDIRSIWWGRCARCLPLIALPASRSYGKTSVFRGEQRSMRRSDGNCGWTREVVWYACDALESGTSLPAAGVGFRHV